MRFARLARLALLLAPSGLLASCGGGSSGPCPGTERSLEILAPADGERVTGTEVELTILACHFDLADRIVVKLLQPLETDYAFVMPDGDVSTITRTVPVIPGTMQLRAQTEDGSVQSATVTIDASAM